MARFFVPQDAWSGEVIALPDAEARHAARVLRMGPGDAAEIFDGTGRVAEVAIGEADKRAVSVRVRSIRVAERAQPGIHLIVALIKGERFDVLVQKATEIGAASIRPVAAARCVVRLDGKDAEKRRDKWRQASIEAAKQCGHVILPDILPVCVPAEAFASAPPGARGIPALHPGGRTLGDFLAGTPGDVTFAIGPEGDWTEEEMREAEGHGFVPLQLGRHVLRSETAALYVLSAASHELHRGAGGLHT